MRTDSWDAMRIRGMWHEKMLAVFLFNFFMFYWSVAD